MKATRRRSEVIAGLIALILPWAALAASVGVPGDGAPTALDAARPTSARAVTTNPAPDTAGRQPLAVIVTSMSPEVIRSNSRTVIKGVVRNNSGSAVPEIEIRPSLSTARYSSVPELELALDPNRALSTRSLAAPSVAVTGPIEPEAEGRWRVVLPPGVLDAWADGVFVLSINARSVEDVTVAGTARLALPWFDSGGTPSSSHRMSLTWLWPLTAAPGRDAEGILLNDQLPAELAPGGRLAGLSAAASTNPELVTWVLDPALLETAASMSTGYQVAEADGRAGPVQPGTTAADWLARVKSATGGPDVDVWALTYADVDVDSLAPAKLGADAVLANTLAPGSAGRVLGRKVQSVIGWPAGTTLTNGVIGLYRSADVEALILDRSSGAGNDAPESLTSVGLKGSRITAVTGDPRLARTLAGSTSAGEIRGIEQRQLFLAQLAIMSQVERRRTAVVAPNRNWSVSATVLRDLLRVLPEIRWLRLSTLSSLLTDEPPTTTARSSSSAPGKRSGRLGDRYLKQIRVEQKQLTTFSEILAPPGDIAGAFETALLRAESVAWRERKSEGRRLLDRISAQFAATRDRVRPISGGQITLASATSRVPVTVANDLDVAVTVGVRLTGDPAIRLVQSEAIVIEIPPGQKVGTEVPVQLLGAGELPVDLQLTTPSGLPYGEPTRLTLRTTAYGAAAGYVVTAAFVALAITIAISAVRRRRRLASGPDGPAPDDDRSGSGPGDDRPS